MFRGIFEKDGSHLQSPSLILRGSFHNVNRFSSRGLRRRKLQPKNSIFKIIKNTKNQINTFQCFCDFTQFNRFSKQ